MFHLHTKRLSSISTYVPYTGYYVEMVGSLLVYSQFKTKKFNKICSDDLNLAVRVLLDKNIGFGCMYVGTYEAPRKRCTVEIEFSHKSTTENLKSVKGIAESNFKMYLIQLWVNSNPNSYINWST